MRLTPTSSNDLNWSVICGMAVAMMPSSRYVHNTPHTMESQIAKILALQMSSSWSTHTAPASGGDVSSELCPCSRGVTFSCSTADPFGCVVPSFISATQRKQRSQSLACSARTRQTEGKTLRLFSLNDELGVQFQDLKSTTFHVRRYRNVLYMTHKRVKHLYTQNTGENRK